MFTTLTVRLATSRDIESILRIYNQGIEDRIATLETVTKDLSYMVAFDRSFRGQGVGSSLLESLHKGAKENNFYKIVLFTFPYG